MTLLPSRRDVEQFRTVIEARFGLQYDDAKLDYLAELLGARMEAAGCPRFELYADRLGRADEGRVLAQQLTVNETFFFRNADNFRALSELVLPDRIRARASDRRLRILSAGCASGEEPYSLAVAVREAIPALHRWDVTIVGIDINRAMLDKAARARYSTWSLRATPEHAQRRYFSPAGKEFALDHAIQAMVTFEERNLVDADSVFWQQGFDIVFCRNVIMYFTPEVAEKVVARIGGALLPGGYLFLGHAETLRGISQEFHLCHTHDTFYYRKRGGEIDEVTEVEQVALPAMQADSMPWPDVIQQTSDRIAKLAGPRRDRERPPVPAAVPRRNDLQIVLEAMRQERFADALLLMAALPAADRAPDALLVHAVLLVNTGQMAEAASAATRLLAVEELNAGAHYVMALCREHAGDADAARKHDETAIYLDAGFAMPHLHLGIAARRAGDTDTAERELRQALILLAREDASRLLLFGGGFSRETLLALCRTQLRAIGAER